MNNSGVSAFFLRHFVATTRHIAYKIWMLDQASTDRTPGVMAWWKANTRRWVPWARYRNVQYQGFRADENMGFARGNNFLAAMGTAPWILFINNDAFPRRDDHTWLLRMRNTAALNGWAAIGPTSDKVMGLQDWKWDSEWPTAHPLKVISGMCVLVRRDVWEKIGWDEEFLNGDEDCAFSINMRRDGHTLGCDRSVYLQHLCNTTMLDWCKERGETVKEHFYHTRQQLIKKYGMFFLRDLWEWQSLRTPKAEWPKLGVLPNGFFWHPPGKPSDTTTLQGKLSARTGTETAPAVSGAGELHSGSVDRTGTGAHGAQGGAAQGKRDAGGVGGEKGIGTAGGRAPARAGDPGPGRGGARTERKDFGGAEHRGTYRGTDKRAGALALSLGREEASRRAAGRDPRRFEHHFGGSAESYAYSSVVEGDPCPYEGTRFVCSCQTLKEGVA